MNKCPITYEPCGDERYSRAGLNKLSPKLQTLIDLPFTAQDLRREAAVRAGKMSIQGVQPKLSTKLSIQTNAMEIVDQGGNFILKPQSDLFPQVTENEDLTMKMAAICGIEVPFTGLIYAKDGSLNYFIQRFDRYARNKKYHVEDFAQLTGNNRETKYKWSMEKLIPVLNQYCTFPLLEKRKLFRRTLFCFVTGNEDMHLKNWSLIRQQHKIGLSPAYDLLNTTIAMSGVTEELALPLAGKKSKITGDQLINYFGKERLELNEKTIAAEVQNLNNCVPDFLNLIQKSFLNSEMQEKYTALFLERLARLNS